eukprot:TRINITY_DN38_c0_g2_i1.p1 TRINITY_DN38_c0_g2~~TRINITY_DN38_c0_g2_i1.p1  ORF type:complete len:473 (-),score=134.02 TRINITY_DN38_c0_g2_i1:431-1849(-)
MSLVEQQYRRQGIEKGYLKSEEYVKFSEQAYGISIMAECKKDPSKCKFQGDEVYRDDTEGGEIPLIYYFRDQLKNALLPHEVCPYIATESQETDHKCPGMEEALKKNPIEFSVKKFSTLYDIDSIKKALVESNNNLGFSTPIPVSHIYYPNTDAYKATIKKYMPPTIRHGVTRSMCEKDPVPCPLDGDYPTADCIRCNGGFHDFDGDFVERNDLTLEGGHAMNLVGFNDDFMTTEGHKGIFIIKNSWGDGSYGGSHTTDFLAQRISKQDDEYVCPNAWFPQNWYACTDGNDCLSEDAKVTVKAMNQPLELACSKHGSAIDICKDAEKNPDTVYFLKSIVDELDFLNVYCFHEYDTKTKTFGADFCTDAIPESVVASYFNPIDADTVNDADRCGFYMMSYHTYLKWQAQFHGMFANGIQLEFTDASYAAHQDSSKSYDLVKKSTSTQNTYIFNGPFPQYDSVLPKDKKKSFRA